MERIKKLVGLLTFGVVASTTHAARADFRVCNNHSATMWVSASAYMSKTTTLKKPCSTTDTSGSGCYWSAWLTAGWYRADPGQCVSPFVGNMNNRFVYVRAEFADGALVDGNFFNTVQYQSGFGWHQFETFHGGNCLNGRSIPDPCSAQPVSRGFSQIDIGSATNYTLTIN